jgi:hypothetical protein
MSLHGSSVGSANRADGYMDEFIDRRTAFFTRSRVRASIIDDHVIVCIPLKKIFQRGIRSTRHEAATSASDDYALPLE